MLTEKDGKLFGRGSTDDKGPVAGWFNCIESFHDAGVPLPINLKVATSLRTTCHCHMASAVLYMTCTVHHMTCTNLYEYIQFPLIPVRAVHTLVLVVCVRGDGGERLRRTGNAAAEGEGLFQRMNRTHVLFMCCTAYTVHVTLIPKLLLCSKVKLRVGMLSVENVAESSHQIASCDVM